MIQISCPFNWPNSFKLNAKHLMWLCNNRCASYVSPPMTARPISSSHVSMVNCTLGWGDKISQVLKVEGMDCDYYVECGEMTHYLRAFTSSTFQHPYF
jgi:hypothetical protein